MSAINVSVAHDLRTLLEANLARVSEWLKYAETKNAALMTFSSAAVAAMFAIRYGSQEIPSMAAQAIAVASPMFSCSAIVCLISFLPRLNLQVMLSRVAFLKKARSTIERMAGNNDLKADPKFHNLLYFGHIRFFSASEYLDAVSEKYHMSIDDSDKDLLLDLAAQIVVNSKIAHRKYSDFNAAAFVILAGFFVGAFYPFIMRI